MPRQSPFQRLHSFRRHLPLRRPDRLYRWAIIAWHTTWVAPTAVSQAMRNVRPPRRDLPPNATARPFAMTSTNAPGLPAASAPCAERGTRADHIQRHAVTLSASATIIQAASTPQGRTAPPASPGAARRGVRCPLGGHVDTGSGGQARCGRSAEQNGSEEPASPLNRILAMRRLGRTWFAASS